MGVQYAVHHLLKGLPNRECNLGSRTASLAKRGDNKSAGPETGQVEGWMDAVVGECTSMDCVRRTMMNQEKIFSEQVLELHRLYRVQKVLMSELSKGLRSPSSSAAAVSSSVASDAKSGGLWSSASDSRVNVLSSTGGSAQMGRRPCWYSVDMESRVVVPCSSTTVQVPPRPICEEHNNRVAVEKIEDGDLDLTLRIGSICSRAKARKLEAAESGSKDTTRLAAMAFTSTHGMPWKMDHAHAGHVISFHTPMAAAGLQSPQWLPQALSLNRT